jgi:hypothetical protein
MMPPAESLGGLCARLSGAFRGSLRSSFHLALGPQNAAPFLVLGDGHAALDADPHSLAGFSIAGKELFQNGHRYSVSDFYLRRISGSEGLLKR